MGRSRFLWIPGLLVVASLCAPSIVPAATYPTDFTGVWFAVQPDGPEFQPPPSLTPEAGKYLKEQRAAAARGEVSNNAGGRCVPPGVPRIMTRGYPLRIIMTPKDLVLLHEYQSQVRYIYLDGREHPGADDLFPSFNGHSIGRWEEKDLLVDTIGIKHEGGGWPVHVNAGVRISADFNLKERWIMATDGKSFTIEFTMTDPRVFTRPWVTRKLFQRRDDLEIMEQVCLPDEE